MSVSFSFKDTKNIALAQPLKVFIKDNLNPSPDEQSLADAAADELEKARYKYIASLKNGENRAIVKQAFTAYFTKLKPLGVRFPFGENSSSGGLFGFFGGDSGAAAAAGQRIVSVKFSYQDQLNPTKWHESWSLNFEIANTVINYANRLTRDAVELFDPNNDATISDAYKLYSEAAALYQWLSQQQDITILGQTLTPELSFDVLTFYSLICFAAGQALFVERSILKKSSAAIIATLAAGATKAFEDARAAAMSSPSAKMYLSSGINWINICDFNRSYWLATANLWFGKTQFDTAKYGEEIAYLYCAKTAVNDCTKYQESINKISPKSLQKRSDLSSVINTRLAAAEKDNSSVYFAQVPQEVALVNPRIMADYAKSVNEDYFDKITDAFSMLVDASVRELIDSTQHELEGMVHAIETGVEGLNNQAREEMYKMGLPGALESLEMGSQQTAQNPTQLVPEDLWTKINNISRAGGVDGMERMLNSTKQGAGYVAQKVAEFRTLLQKEKADDDQLRAQYGPQKWSRQTSDSLIKPMLDSCTSIETLLKDAKKSDEICFAEFNQLKLELAPIVRMDRSTLGQSLPKPVQNNQALLSKPFVVDLKNLVTGLSALIGERDAQIRAARTLLGELIHQLRTQLPGSTDREAFATKLRDRLHNEALLPLHAEHQLPKQKDLMQRINVANRAFQMGVSAANGGNQLQSSQLETALQKYYQATNNYERVSKHLNEGAKFYKDLGADTIAPLEQRVKDYCMARDMEKKMWVEDLVVAMSRMNVQPSPQAQQGQSQGYYNQNSYAPSFAPPQNGYNAYPGSSYGQPPQQQQQPPASAPYGYGQPQQPNPYQYQSQYPSQQGGGYGYGYGR